MTIRVYQRTFTPTISAQPRSKNAQVSTREDLLAGASRFNCYYCAKSFEAREATLEHVIPLSHGGTYHRDNCALACGWCNGHRNQLVVALAKGFKTEHFPQTLWKGIVNQGGKFHFVVSREQGFVPQPAFKSGPAHRRAVDKPTDRAQHIEDLQHLAAVRGDDIGWFKLQLSEVDHLLQDGKTEEARARANAAASLPKTLSPTDYPGKTEEWISMRLAEEVRRLGHPFDKPGPLRIATIPTTPV